MLTDKLQAFYQRVHCAIAEVGNSPPRIADIVIAEAFPDTADAAGREGADKMLRDGVIEFVTKYLKRSAAATAGAQSDFSDVSDAFLPIIGRLQNNAHYVPTLSEHMPIGFLIMNPAYLDEARKFKRQKGRETLAEADVLDELYMAITEQAEAA